MAEKRRVGVLGGTFDPVHAGHIALAKAALEQLALECVIFIPAGRPWRKSGREIAPAPHRADMVRLAIEGQSAFRLCTAEVGRPGPTYTVETLQHLRQKFPGHDLILILGADALADLPNWREPQRITQLATLAVAPRAAGENGPLPAAIEGATVIPLQMDRVDVSSTAIRNSIADGRPVLGLAPAVERYIHEHGLYSRRKDRN